MQEDNQKIEERSISLFEFLPKEEERYNRSPARITYSLKQLALEVSRYAVLNAVDMAYWWNSLEYTPRSSIISFTAVSLTVDQVDTTRGYVAPSLLDTVY
ncbi:hypothetical protein Tco_1052029 [Tanacetum coccineum]